MNENIFYEAHIISYKDTILPLNDIKDYFEFINNPIYVEFINDSIKSLKRRKIETLDVKKFLKDVGLIYNDRLNDMFIPTHKMIFSSIITSIEKIYGDILLSKNPTYSDIIEMQYTIKVMKDYFNDKGLVNFTNAQSKGSETIRNNFKEKLPEFKQILKEI